MTDDNKNSADFRDKVDTIKQLVDPALLLEDLGFEITRETDKEIRCPCKIHDGDNTTAFRLNKDLKTWVCFSHKCNERYGNDVFGLVMSIRECNFVTALNYLEDFSGAKGVHKNRLIKYRQRKEREKFIKLNSNGREKPSIVDPIRLKYYKYFRSSFFIEEGFLKETLDYFEIAGGYSDSDGLIKDIIPIYNDKGNLVAFSKRDIRRGLQENYRKYQLTEGFNKDTVLYNLSRILDIVDKTPLIIVEGFKSVWRLYELGIYNVVACMGSGITTGQAQLLFTYAHKGVVFFFDNDYAGVSAVGRSYELLKGKMKVYLETITEEDESGNGLDPADLTDEQIFYYLKNYISKEVHN